MSVSHALSVLTMLVFPLSSLTFQGFPRPFSRRVLRSKLPRRSVRLRMPPRGFPFHFLSFYLYALPDIRVSTRCQLQCEFFSIPHLYSFCFSKVLPQTPRYLVGTGCFSELCFFSTFPMRIDKEIESKPKFMFSPSLPLPPPQLPWAFLLEK